MLHQLTRTMLGIKERDRSAREYIYIYRTDNLILNYTHLDILKSSAHNPCEQSRLQRARRRRQIFRDKLFATIRNFSSRSVASSLLAMKITTRGASQRRGRARGIRDCAAKVSNKPKEMLRNRTKLLCAGAKSHSIRTSRFREKRSRCTNQKYRIRRTI